MMQSQYLDEVQTQGAGNLCEQGPAGLQTKMHRDGDWLNMLRSSSRSSSSSSSSKSAFGGLMTLLLTM